MDEVLRSVVLPFCVKTSESTKPRKTMPELTSLESAKTLLCALTGQFAHQTSLQHVYDIFGLGVHRIIMASRNSQPLGALLQEITMLTGDADPSAPNHQYSEYAKPVVVLICC